MIFSPFDPRIDIMIYTTIIYLDGEIMLLHGYLQHNKSVIGNFSSLLCKNYIDTAETSVSTTRVQRVIYIYGGTVAACLDNIYDYILSFLG